MPPDGENDELRDASAIRARLHRIADMVHAHEGQLREHGVLLTVLSQHYEALRAQAATRDQLQATMQHVDTSATLTKQHVDHKIAETNLKIDGVANDLAPIKRGVQWTVGIVIGSVLAALLGLVLAGPL